MNAVSPIVIDQNTGIPLWRTVDCAAYCGVTESTWHSYSRKNSKLNPPKPVAHLDQRTPLWDAEEVKTWQASRPGSPVANSPKAQK